MMNTVSPEVTPDSTLAGRMPGRKQLEDIFVVDLDVHLRDGPGDLAPHCAMPWRKGLQELAARGDDDGLFEGPNPPPRDMPGFAVMPIPWLLPMSQIGTTRRRFVRSPAVMRKDLDALGIDVGVLFPDRMLRIGLLKPPAYAIELARAYNRWLVEEWLDEDNGLVGAILACHHDPIVAAEEIRRYADHPRVAAIFLPTAGVTPLYGNRYYDPIYDAAQEANLPVVLHATNAPDMGFETLFATHFLTHSIPSILILLSMMETGVPVRFPKLKICFTECGIAWIAWMLLRMDKEYMHYRRELSFLKDRPSEIVSRQMFFATQPIEEPRQMRDLATLFPFFDGENTVVFASDWPHQDFDHPSKLLEMATSDDVRRKILGRNAARLLNLVEPPR